MCLYLLTVCPALTTSNALDREDETIMDDDSISFSSETDSQPGTLNTRKPQQPRQKSGAI